MAWKFGGFCLGGSTILAPFVMMIFLAKWKWSFTEVGETPTESMQLTHSINSSSGYSP
jgi:hypothetical protein